MALWAIRVYLLILLTLIGIKFVRVFKSSSKAPDAAVQTSTSTPASTIKP
jgi:hypothetical protein